VANAGLGAAVTKRLVQNGLCVLLPDNQCAVRPRLGRGREALGVDITPPFSPIAKVRGG